MIVSLPMISKGKTNKNKVYVEIVKIKKECVIREDV